MHRCGRRPTPTLLAGFLFLLGMTTAWLPPAAAQSPAIDRSEHSRVAAIVKKAMPAVVNISTTRQVQSGGGQPPDSPFADPRFREFFGDEFGRRFEMPREWSEASLGSGVIVDPGGIIVTNYHVVAQADEIRVVLSDRREFVARVVGADPKTDVAVIRIDAKNLPVLAWGDSDKLQIAEPVFAIGTPFGLNQTVTAGIVSAVGRANVGIADYEDFIQTDAAINPGNSGGALINERGELIGINTAIFSQSGGYMGIGFAVPSNMVRDVMRSLIETGRVVRGWLGVSIQEVTPDLAKKFGQKRARGALVSEVMEGSPAAQGGIRSGDIVVAFNGKEIETAGALRNLVAQTSVGTEVKVRLVRDGQPVTVTVKVTEQPRETVAEGETVPGGTDGAGLTGLDVRNLSPDIAKQLGLQPGLKGVLISAIDPASDAALAGLQPGDVISEINRKPVGDVEDYKRLVAGLPPKEDVLLLVIRPEGKHFLVVER